MKSIEGEFPFEYLSEVAEIESWRKELYRPIYYMHKWWARRLGTVFRAVILGSYFEQSVDIMDLLYQPVDLNGLTIFDPFMGSGTTVGEAYKLGCTVIGKDINPVAYQLSRLALAKISRKSLQNQFNRLRDRVAPDLLALYKGFDKNGQECDVLYYFWVKVLPCPACKNPVDLFSTYIFARHAYPKKHPLVHIVCPDCGFVFPGDYNADTARCPDCDLSFNPHFGNVNRTKATCRVCGESFTMVKVAGADGHPPEHRLYAKLVLSNGGNKNYLSITEQDIQSFRTAQERLRALKPVLPHLKINPGYNTRQILNYGYHYWDQMFNERQLLALSFLANGIKELPSSPERDVLALLFSGVLEFNNMFASYKGEGTGAVRHLFSHHILKPERMAIEANLWGTDKSSGSFQNLFYTRILRAMAYKEAPFEVAVKKTATQKRGKKVFGLSLPIEAEVIDAYPNTGSIGKAAYLSCGDSAQTDLPTASVDLIVTDPPFFNNVHYSELADFFFVWQQLHFQDQPSITHTTRHPNEVQDINVDAFARKLTDVFVECHRILRLGGLLVFSYHHSRDEGWTAVAEAVLDSQFSFVQAQPVKAEMSVATPKSQASSPIDLDVFLVCKKREDDNRPTLKPDIAFTKAYNIAASKIERFNRLGRRLSLNDVKVVLYSQLLVALSPGRNRNQLSIAFELLTANTDEDIHRLAKRQREIQVEAASPYRQLSLF